MKIFELLGEENDNTVCRVLVTHENKTLSQFKQDINSLMVKYGESYIEANSDYWITCGDWIVYASKKLSELGYVKIETERYTISGSGIIAGSKVDNKFRRIVGSDMYNKAKEHNATLRGVF